MLVRPWSDLVTPVELSAVAADAYATGYLERVAFLDFVVVKLIGMDVTDKVYPEPIREL